MRKRERVCVDRMNQSEKRIYEGMYEKEEEIKKRVRGTGVYLASVNTALAFFSLSPSHLFSIVEASTVRNVAPPFIMMMMINGKKVAKEKQFQSK